MQKEQYYTSKTIKIKSQEMLSSLEANRRRHSKVSFAPEKAALLILDMQEYFLSEASHAFVPSAPTVVTGMNRLITAFESAQQPVIATRHLNTPEDAGMMSKWWRELIKAQSAHSHIVTQLELSNAILLDKSQYDAFYNTTLDTTLRARSVEQVIITGVMTHLCCETTARSAFMRGFEVFFTVDGTATYNEELHRASLLTLSHGFAVPVLIEELLQKMNPNEA